MPKKRNSNEEFKALITADLHLSNGLPHAKQTQDGLTDRFEDQLKVIEQIREIGEKENVDEIFILGDVFDKHLLDAVTLRYSMEAFRNLAPIPVCILPGNHDAHSQVGKRFVSEIFREESTGWDHVDFLDYGDRLEFGIDENWLTFWPLPFAPLDITRGRLAKYREELKGRSGLNILLAHHSVIGSEHLAWTCDAGLTVTEITEGFDYVLSGHFHKEQDFLDINNEAHGAGGRYVGVPMQLSYGEEGYSAKLHVMTFHQDPDKDIFEKKSFPTNTPKFFTRPISPKISKQIQKGDYLKLEAKATHVEWAKIKTSWEMRCKELQEKGIHAKIVHKPIYHHEERLDENSVDVGGMPDLISGYVNSNEVVTDGSNKKHLKKLGLEILEEARAKKGGTV